LFFINFSLLGFQVTEAPKVEEAPDTVIETPKVEETPEVAPLPNTSTERANKTHKRK